MSTTRRQLGTGPTPSTRTTPSTAPPRLLPAERIEHDALLAVAVDEQLPARSGRRILGTGTTTTT